MFAFADAFFAAMHEPDKGITPYEDTASGLFKQVKYIFLLTIGMAEIDYIDDNPHAMVIFAFAALFNLIVMLNLLIAIISETYENVKRDHNKFLQTDIVRERHF